MKIYSSTVIVIAQDFAALSCIITIYSYSAHATYSNFRVFKKGRKKRIEEKIIYINHFRLLP